MIQLTKMQNPFPVSDSELIKLINSFLLWQNSTPKEQEWINKNQKRNARYKKTLLNKKFIEDSSEHKLHKEIFDYSRTLDGPAIIRLGIPRLKGEQSRIKSNLLYIIDSTDDLFLKIHNVIEGKYNIPLYKRAFWTPLLNIAYPNNAPNWNNKTQNFFSLFGIDLETKKKTVSEKYRIISEAFKYLQSLNSKLDFLLIDHLMHYATTVPRGENQIFDIIPDKEFQESIQDVRQYTKEIKGLSKGPIKRGKPVENISSISFPRKPARSAKALKNANYTCEENVKHKTFIQEKNSKHFFEAHHLIPMKAQGDIENDIDRPENIVSLCPNCHRAIEKLKLKQRKEMVEKFYEIRKNKLEKIGVIMSIDKLLSYYNI